MSSCEKTRTGGGLRARGRDRQSPAARSRLEAARQRLASRPDPFGLVRFGVPLSGFPPLGANRAARHPAGSLPADGDPATLGADEGGRRAARRALDPFGEADRPLQKQRARQQKDEGSRTADGPVFGPARPSSPCHPAPFPPRPPSGRKPAQKASFRSAWRTRSAHRPANRRHETTVVQGGPRLCWRL